MNKFNQYVEVVAIANVIDTLNDMVDNNIVDDYAIGGATALLYYTQPTFITEDIDVFVVLKQASILIDLGQIYLFLKSKYEAKERGEYLIVNGIPLQFLVPNNPLVQEAFDNAKTVVLNNKKFKIFTFEHLIAIMINLSSPKYKSRLMSILEENKFDSKKLDSILTRYNLMSKWNSLKEKLL